jgi:hypothetical protein
LTEVGIGQRTAEKLEEYAGVITLAKLLRMTWDTVCGFARPAAEGGIPNFGPKALDEIRFCLKAHGFNALPGTEWILEQHTQAYQDQEMARPMSKRRRRK